MLAAAPATKRRARAQSVWSAGIASLLGAGHRCRAPSDEAMPRHVHAPVDSSPVGPQRGREGGGRVAWRGVVVANRQRSTSRVPARRCRGRGRRGGKAVCAGPSAGAPAVRVAPGGLVADGTGRDRGRSSACARQPASPLAATGSRRNARRRSSPRARSMAQVSGGASLPRAERRGNATPRVCPRSFVTRDGATEREGRRGEGSVAGRRRCEQAAQHVARTCTAMPRSRS